MKNFKIVLDFDENRKFIEVGLVVPSDRFEKLFQPVVDEIVTLLSGDRDA